MKYLIGFLIILSILYAGLIYKVYEDTRPRTTVPVTVLK
jgi:hypothetical protein